ncbi:MAG: phosphonate C-P lyase system protein PhnG [Gallionella sp.]|nr:phosphonate C-P lyase system protein PhnG [Gallionella sp.]
MNIPREDWPSALCALHANEVKQTVAALLQNIEVHDVALPQAGLGLLSLRDGALHESFFIGEMPVARAEVLVRTPAGDEVRGGAVIIDDRAQFARTIAILDAVLAGKLSGWEQAASLVQQGIAVRKQKDSERKKLLAVTRVDFSLLGQEDDEDAE